MVKRYFDDLETAANMLAPYVGKTIVINGQTETLNGSLQTYFSATSEQKANETGNYVLGFAPTPSIIPGMSERDQIRLEQASTMNGSVISVYPIEEVMLGGPLTSKLLGVLGRSLGGEGGGEAVQLFRNLEPAEQIVAPRLFPASQIQSVGYNGKLNYVVTESGELVLGKTGH